MRSTLIAVFVMLAGQPVFAATQVNEVISSATVAGISVTTGTYVRVDNRYSNNQASIIANRVAFSVQNQNATYKLYCDYDTTFSTASTSIANLAQTIGPGDTKIISGSRDLTFYCQCADGAGAGGCAASVEQYGKE